MMNKDIDTFNNLLRLKLRSKMDTANLIISLRNNGLLPVKYIADVLRKLLFCDTDYMAFLPINIAK